VTRDEEAALAELEFHFTSPHTQEEIAEFLGYTQQRVSQIEARALAKLKALIKKRALQCKVCVDIEDMW
jgi:DNA-directed RNA polymerase sigma subunit (sigma70/sigma32)